jgi:hypothetical protein
MAQFAVFIPYIIAAAGTLLQGASAKQQGDAEGAQLDYVAGQTRAASQREAIERRRSSRYAQSRAQALAASSGAGASDPTVVNLIADLAGEGEYGALAAMYEGEDQATGFEHSGKLSRAQGNAAMSGAVVQAGSTLLSGGNSWYDKYGGRGAPNAIAPGVAGGTARADYQNQYGIKGPRYA